MMGFYPFEVSIGSPPYFFHSPEQFEDGFQCSQNPNFFTIPEVGMSGFNYLFEKTPCMCLPSLNVRSLPEAENRPSWPCTSFCSRKHFPLFRPLLHRFAFSLPLMTPSTLFFNGPKNTLTFFPFACLFPQKEFFRSFSVEDIFSPLSDGPILW